MDKSTPFTDFLIGICCLAGAFALYRYNRYWIRKKKEEDIFTYSHISMSIREWMFIVLLAGVGIVKLFSCLPKEI